MQAAENNRNFAESSELTAIDTTPRTDGRNGYKYPAGERCAERCHKSGPQCCPGYGDRLRTCLDSPSSAFLWYILGDYCSR